MRERRPLSSAGTLTIAGLAGTAVGIWIQSLSGVPDYPSRFPPGPIILVIVGVGIAIGTRWWWTPLSGALLSLLILVGAFVRPGTGNRLRHPDELAAFIGTVVQMIALVTGLTAGFVATGQNYRARAAGRLVATKSTRGMAKAVCKILGVIFVGLGCVVIVRAAPVDPYHNALHMVTGVLALGFGFTGSASAARTYCLGFGAFYLAFAVIGILAGDSHAFHAWHVGPMHLDLGDHLFHLVLGPSLVAVAWMDRRRARAAPQARGQHPEGVTP